MTIVPQTAFCEEAKIQTHLTLVELAGVDPGLDVGELLHEDGVRDDWQINTEGDDALKVGRGDGVVVRPEAFAVNCLISRFRIAPLLNQLLWVFASPSGKDFHKHCQLKNQSKLKSTQIT